MGSIQRFLMIALMLTGLSPVAWADCFSDLTFRHVPHDGFVDWEKASVLAELEATLEAYRRGDKAAAEKLARQMTSLVWLPISAEITDQDAALDVLQETLVDALEGARTITKPMNLIPYARRAAQTHIEAYQKAAPETPEVSLSRRQTQRIVWRGQGVYEATARREDNERIEGAMLGLLPKQREVVRQRFVDELTLAQIGENQGVSEEAIRQRLVKITFRMRNRYLANFLGLSNMPRAELEREPLSVLQLDAGTLTRLKAVGYVDIGDVMGVSEYDLYQQLAAKKGKQPEMRFSWAADDVREVRVALTKVGLTQPEDESRKGVRDLPYEARLKQPIAALGKNPSEQTILAELGIETLGEVAALTEEALWTKLREAAAKDRPHMNETLLNLRYRALIRVLGEEADITLKR